MTLFKRLKGQKEIQQLKTSIGMLRTNIERVKAQEENIAALASGSNEIKSLKETISDLRNELDRSNAEKDQAVQAEKSNALTEINQLKSSLVMLRQNLETAKARKKINYKSSLPLTLKAFLWKSMAN